MKNQTLKSTSIRLALTAILVITAVSSTFAGAPRPASFAPESLPSPAAIPSALPVYALTPPLVNRQGVLTLANHFSGLQGTEVYTDSSHTNTPRLTTYYTRTGFLLEQYSASGGFFAFNHNRAFSETIANLDYSPYDICMFLLVSELFPPEVPPDQQNCQGATLTYEVHPIYQTTVTATLVDAGPMTSTVNTIGEVWQVPMAIDVGADLGLEQQLYIPLGGPGGHISLLLTGFDNSPPLDYNLPGLQALAMPFHGRQRSIIGVYPVIPAEAATRQFEQQVHAMLPTAVITPGTPQMIYYAEDAAVDQGSMMPTWIFPDAIAGVQGEQVPIRIFPIPGVDGFLPEVAILNPTDGTGYLPNQPLTLTANITGGQEPYTYTLSLEGEVLLAAGAAVSGTVDILVPSMPLVNRSGEPEVRVVLDVTDSNDASGQDEVILQAPATQYLPAISRGLSASRLTLLTRAIPGQTEGPGGPAVVHTMGTEWIRYYNGVLPNLPEVEPDGQGFYHGLQALGWSGPLHWTNNAAWAKDWKDCSLGGIDCTWGVDRAEFIYFAGHGSPARIYFGVSHDSYNAFGADARFQNVRWASFSSCQTLRAGPYVSYGNPPLSYWFNAFQGAYMLMGFHSNMADVAFGPRFVDNMRMPTFLGIPFPWLQRSIREAWVLTAFEMNAGDPAYLYAVSNTFSPVNLKLPTSSQTLPPLNHADIIQYRWTWWD